MLQIITGKFFKSAERHVREERGVLYSNFSWVTSIETRAGKFDPIDFRALQTTYIFSFTNQLEKRDNDVLVSVGRAEIVDQFRVIAGFGLKAIFSNERTWVEQLCRPVTTGSEPAALLPRYFESRLHGANTECKEFSEFVDKLLSLRREDYRSILAALRAFNGALDVVGTNLDLAYSMLVYALESLAQKHQYYSPTWRDYDQTTRDKLDDLLKTLPVDTAEGIRFTLLSHSHLKLRVRFQDFITAHLGASYFTTESVGLKNPLRLCELSRALRNLYQARSNYVHELKPLMRHLSVSQIAADDVFRWEQEPHLTFAGLVRLVQHVVRSLVHHLPSVEHEDYNWRDDLPGIIRMHVAPQYWIHNAGGFTAVKAPRYFTGLLSLILDLKRNEGICNMTAVLEKIEEMYSSGNKAQRRAMLALYGLYNGCIVPEGRRPNWVEFLEKHADVVNDPCIEMMAFRIVLNLDFPYTSDQVESVLQEFDQQRFRKGALELPPIMELAIVIFGANLALRESNPERHQLLMRQALMNSPSRPELQTKIALALKESAEVPISEVIIRLDSAASTA